MWDLCPRGPACDGGRTYWHDPVELCRVDIVVDGASGGRGTFACWSIFESPLSRIEGKVLVTAMHGFRALVPVCDPVLFEFGNLQVDIVMADRMDRGRGVEGAGGRRKGHDGAGTRDRGARCGLLVFLAHGPKQEERDYMFFCLCG